MGGRRVTEMIKLVVWDLDETLWHGTLAEEGSVDVPDEHLAIVRELTDRGIVNSICSKNHFDAARAVLQEHGAWELFVFPHIAFTPKGEAVRQIIADMQLRAPNVLFVDDNAGNLEEVAFYNDGIQVLDATDVKRLLELPGAAGKPDPEHTRLAQYRLLEQRRAARTGAPSNDEFLRASDIRISVVPSTPQDAERVHDMVMRTNQLNFTKKRVSYDEVAALIADPANECASVRVRDRFGDHGVIGWYCLRDGELIHFLFSCRTINLGIEQAVYAHLGHPRLAKVGDTAAEVGPTDVVADYLTLETLERGSVPAAPAAPGIPDQARLRIYALGACDLYYMVGHMATPLTDVHFECNTFNGDTRGVNVGTEYLRSSFEMDDTAKDFCRAHFHNYSGSTVFDSKIFEREYDVVVLSFHDDFALETFRSKADPSLRVMLSTSTTGSFTPVLNPDGVAGFDPSGWLAEHFESEGLISPGRFRDNLDWIAERLPDRTQLVLMTGPEFDYFRDDEPSNPQFRAQVIALNREIRAFCAEHPRAGLVEMNDFITEREHFSDFVMHLKPERSYALAMEAMRQMALRPAGTDRVREHLPLGDRQLALLGTDVTMLTNARVLTALGSAPTCVAAPNTATTLQEVQVVPSSGLYGRNGELYVLALHGGDVDYASPTLRLYGYEPDHDFALLPPSQFTMDWKETV